MYLNYADVVVQFKTVGCDSYVYFQGNDLDPF